MVPIPNTSIKVTKLKGISSFVPMQAQRTSSFEKIAGKTPQRVMNIKIAVKIATPAIKK